MISLLLYSIPQKTGTGLGLAVRYKPLGRTGVKVSAVSLGTATFGVAPLEQDCDRLVGRALDLGINMIDMANSYGNQARFDRPGAPAWTDRHSAEEIVGTVLKGRRDGLILCSKVMEPVGEGVNDSGLSRRHIVQQLEQSLRRLRTDHLDVYYAHHPDAATPIDETIRAFDDLVRQGKLRYYALSTYPAWQVVDALWKAERCGAHAPACLQVQYNLARRDPELDIVPICLANALSLTIFSPLAGGLFAGPSKRTEAFVGRRRWGGTPFTEREIALAEALEQLAQQHGHSPATLALAWLISKPTVASAIVGAEDLDQLEANAAAADLDLPTELLAALDEIGKP
jgi:aryl-alcohol dehydrogenase-like predicted oxidoreductase